MPKIAGIKLELKTDINMFTFIEKRSRGRKSYIAHRYGKANNKYLSDFDNTKP